nr:M23 family metallopeptidase [Clavibacter michiganensis]
MSNGSVERRIRRRSVHPSRSTAVSVSLVLLVLVAAWIGTESVLRAVGAAPLLADPQTVVDAALKPDAAFTTIAEVLAVVLVVAGIVLVVLALTPGRQHRSAVEHDRGAVVIDTAILASAAANAAARPPANAPRPPSSGGQPSSSGWTMPIRSYGSYQSYGMRLHPILGYWRLHAGDDFGAGCGTPIYATAAGTVQFAGGSSGFGNAITLNHGGGVTSVYGHMYSYGVMVRTGQTVQAGQQIGAVGSAGLSTGCHLHFEIRQGGVATSPMPFLRNRGV